MAKVPKEVKADPSVLPVSCIPVSTFLCFTGYYQQIGGVIGQLVKKAVSETQVIYTLVQHRLENSRTLAKVRVLRFQVANLQSLESVLPTVHL